MTGAYDLNLVILSVIVAAIASYTALDLAGRVTSRQGAGSWLWLVGGAFSMGTGIWSMHFIGMLAFELQIPMAYDLTITLLSMLIAMVVSGFALYVVSRPTVTTSGISMSAAIMGIGICGMHYTGMYAMRMFPPIEYDPWLFIASVLIAISVSLAALVLAFQLRKQYSTLAILYKLGSAVVMGAAIAGMHYTGMAAARFAPDSVCLVVDVTGGVESGTLAIIIGLITLALLTITLVISAYDAHFASIAAKHADSLTEANAQLRAIALHDKLTGLPNRFLLEDRLEQAARRADRGGAKFALMFIDIDNFKPVNDEFGHQVGDSVLQTIAKRLLAGVRGSDTVARTGGDEFVIVLNDIGRADDVARVGEKLLAELAGPIDVNGRQLAVTCSIGISIYPLDGTDPDTLLAYADTAMYHAKKRGRNGCRLYTPGLEAATPTHTL